jgi:quercetin dioxygenase-like cupin family protein
LERLSFGADVAFTPREDLLDGVTIAPLTGRLGAECHVKAAIFRVAPNGRIARHPATFPQILAVLEGAGRVRGADGEFQPITAGEAVFWSAGEEHETRTEEGLTALVLEAERLQLWTDHRS